MADTITAAYDFTLPEVGASDDTWGDKNNANWAKTEALLASGFSDGTPADIGKLKTAALPFQVAGSLRHNRDAGYMYIGTYDISTYSDGSARLWYDHSSKRLSMHGVTGGGDSSPVGMGIASTSWLIDNSGYAKIGGTYINSDETGAAVTGAIASTAGDNMTFYSGLTTGALHVFRDSASSPVAYVYPSGTSVPNVQTIMTREKGDLRYAAASSERFKDGIHDVDESALAGAFDELTLREWQWGGELPDTDERVGRTGIGVVAEELASVLPAAVRYSGEQVHGADPLALIAALIAKIREQDTRIAALEGA